MANNEQRRATSGAMFTELAILRLAAIAVDLRGQLAPHELTKRPALAAVLDACENLFATRGWGRPRPLYMTRTKGAGSAAPQTFRDENEP